MEAVERYGVVRGGVMAFTRVLRCHPFVRGGYDPVMKIGDITGEVADDRRPTTNREKPTMSTSLHGAI